MPLTKKKQLAEERNEKLSGVITYSLQAKSPLFIPNTSNENAFLCDVTDHKSYDFFSYEDLSEKKNYEKEYHRPVIPGSEIRGMFRSNYEMLTESCMSAIDENVTLSKRTMARFQAGLLRKKENGLSSSFDLMKAEDCICRWGKSGKDIVNWEKANKEDKEVKTYKELPFKEGQKVYFQYNNRNNKKAKPLAQNVSLEKNEKKKAITEGYLIKGEPGPKMGLKQEKHSAHVFKLNKQNDIVQKDISIKCLTDNLEEYEKHSLHAQKIKGSAVSECKKQGTTSFAYKEYKQGLNDFINHGKKGDYYPVYYSDDTKQGNRYIYLAPACITREIYQTKWLDIIGSFKPCNEVKRLCPACQLFGTVTKNAEAVSSKVRFSDLECVVEKDIALCYQQSVTLYPLATPKISNMEFYLQRPKNASFWTYDYYLDMNGYVHYQKMQIAGRKFYWHNLEPELPKNIEKSNLNITIRPVKPKTVFKGKVYFDGISEKELNQLIYLLNAGDEEKIEEKQHGYKLGTGKPLGLGSVAVAIDNVQIKKLQFNEKQQRIDYVEEEYKNASVEKCGFSEEVLENFEKITNFHTIKEPSKLSYPFVEGQTRGQDGYEWFTRNHRDRNKPDNDKPMPKDRNYMYFAEYMEAMNPELKKVEIKAYKK